MPFFHYHHYHLFLLSFDTINYHLLSFIFTRMFYLTGASTHIYSIALNLLLIVVFWFPTLISMICDSKEIIQLNNKVNRHFYDMVKICIIIIWNVNIFTIYDTSFENVMRILPTTYQNKTKMPGKKFGRSV